MDANTKEEFYFGALSSIEKNSQKFVLRLLPEGISKRFFIFVVCVMLALIFLLPRMLLELKYWTTK